MKTKINITEWLPAVAVLLIVAALIGCFIIKLAGGMNIPFSDGQRTGKVYKISKKGFFWKTWEGEMSMQMLERNADGQLVPKIFAFSVTSEEVAKQIEAASAAGDTTTLAYRQLLLRGFDDGETQYDVTGLR